MVICRSQGVASHGGVLGWSRLTPSNRRCGTQSLQNDEQPQIPAEIDMTDTVASDAGSNSSSRGSRSSSVSLRIQSLLCRDGKH